MTNTRSKWEKLIEELAEVEHTRWADWQTWCHKVLRQECPSPELEKVLERWDVQIATKYKDLTEMEKDSDRYQVGRYLKIVKSFIHSTLQKYADKVEKEIREMRIRLNEKNILVYKVEIDNYNMAIDDIVKTLNKLNITYGLNKEDE